MTIKEIYEAFDKIGCLSFTTIDENNYPISRIAHLRGYDDDGIYFMTMYTKDFYKHIMSNGKIAICGLNAKTEVSHNESGMPVFDNGYAIRMTGDVKEISIDELKAKNNPLFDFCIKDYETYNAMVVLCITKGSGDIFDYDFELEHRENKLERIYFSYNDKSINYKGLEINQEKCISCGLCFKKCSFKAIIKDDNKYTINKNRCDECGDCYIVCPLKAINYRG